MENMQIYITFLVLMTIGACFFFIKVNKNIKKEKKNNNKNTYVQTQCSTTL